MTAPGLGLGNLEVEPRSGGATSQPSASIRQSTGNAVRHRNQHRADQQRRPGVGGAEDQPLQKGVQEDSHKQQVYDAGKSAFQKFASRLAVEENPIDVGWSATTGIRNAAPNADYRRQ